MKLRRLQKKDAPLMLEWMHDKDVVQFLNGKFASKTIEDCEQFIENSTQMKNNIHLAIVDENDIYMGTVSLKHMNMSPDRIAEFAIALRRCAMGKGFSQFAMREMIRYGLEALELDAIYWCVSTENKRAIRFYDKNQYLRTENVPEILRQNYEPANHKSLIWYVKGKDIDNIL